MNVVCSKEYVRLMEIVYFASRHADNGNVVQLQNYIGLPHVFVVFEKHPSTETCYNELAKFITSVTHGEKVETRMQVVNGKGKLVEKPLDFNEYPIDFSKEEVPSPKRSSIDVVGCEKDGRSRSKTETQIIHSLAIHEAHNYEYFRSAMA